MKEILATSIGQYPHHCVHSALLVVPCCRRESKILDKVDTFDAALYPIMRVVVKTMTNCSPNNSLPLGPHTQHNEP